MSYFTDFLVADAKGAATIAREIEETADPTAKWPGVSVKSISSLDMANLYRILRERAEPGDVFVLLREFEQLCCEPPEGPVVELVPEGLVVLLSQLDENRLSPAAAKWAETEGISGRWEPADLEQLLQELRELARRSQVEGKSLLICISGV